MFLIRYVSIVGIVIELIAFFIMVLLVHYLVLKQLNR